jgi:hypothetical protein
VNIAAALFTTQNTFADRAPGIAADAAETAAMAPSVLTMARNFEVNDEIGSTSRQKSMSVPRPSHESSGSSEIDDVTSPILSESTSWQSRQPSSPVTSSSDASASEARARLPEHSREQYHSRSPVRPKSKRVQKSSRVQSDMGGAHCGGEHARELVPSAVCMARTGSGQVSARRALSHNVTPETTGLHRPRAMPRQWSQLSSATDMSDGRRKSSFARRYSRRDSQDSVFSGASEPLSYSNNLYVASDIWLAEKKLDNVEGEIIQREGDKARRRQRMRKDPHDPFGEHAESQNISSRLVGLLWSNPVASNAAGACASRRQPNGGRRQRRGQAGERGGVGSEGKFTSKQSFTMVDNMPGAFPHVESNIGGRARQYSREDLNSHDIPRKHMSYHVKQVAKKADVGRWLRRRVHRRAERRDLY